MTKNRSVLFSAAGALTPAGPGPWRRRMTGSLVTTLAVLLAVLASCTSPTPEQPPVPPGTGEACSDPLPTFQPFRTAIYYVGTDTTLDLATWNLEFFPQRLPGGFDRGHPVDVRREQQVADLINRMGLDILAVEEISDSTGFFDTVDLCPGYDAIMSPEYYRGVPQLPGVIYRRDQVTVHGYHLLFPSNDYIFPRLPLQVDMTITSNNRSYDLHLIVVHLKASGDSESAARRRAASDMLKNYLDQQAAVDPGANYLIAGDWNDTLEDPAGTNSFLAFLDDPGDYLFLDLGMAGNLDFVSYPTTRGGSLIDHLMVNRAACEDFADGRVTTLRLDLFVSEYDNISDHRPVFVQAPLFK